jgi:DNA-binding SARP family transcriptional activator
MRRLQLRLFGSFDARLDEHVVTEFESISARALLAYLAVERGCGQPRTTLATLLWGPNAGATGLTNLRSCLRRVRSALGDGDSASPLLQVTQDAVQLDPTVDLGLDVHTFDALLATVTAHPHRRVQDCPWCVARLTEAVALYRGPFLAGLSIDSIFFEEWQQFQQERYQRRVMQALYVLTDYHLRRGNLAQAEQFARRQLTLEAWNEEAHVQLMLILAASGQRSAALAQYARCRTALAAELDVIPMPATTALYDEMRSSPAADSGATFRSTVSGALLGPNNLPLPVTELIDRFEEIDWLL